MTQQLMGLPQIQADRLAEAGRSLPACRQYNRALAAPDAPPTTDIRPLAWLRRLIPLKPAAVLPVDLFYGPDGLNKEAKRHNPTAATKVPPGGESWETRDRIPHWQGSQVRRWDGASNRLFSHNAGEGGEERLESVPGTVDPMRGVASLDQLFAQAACLHPVLRDKVSLFGWHLARTLTHAISLSKRSSPQPASSSSLSLFALHPNRKKHTPSIPTATNTCNKRALPAANTRPHTSGQGLGLGQRRPVPHRRPSPLRLPRAARAPCGL
jgi:hypothetical protein